MFCTPEWSSKNLMPINWKITPRKIRFSLVSSTATAIDLLVLFILISSGVGLLIANFASTSAGFAYSFIASKKYAFKTANRHLPRELVQFLVITLTGIWLLQPLLIWQLEPVLIKLRLHGLLVALVAKLAASLVTFIWNYLWYTRLVFRKKH